MSDIPYPIKMYPNIFKACKKSGEAIFPGQHLVAMNGMVLGDGYTCQYNGQQCSAATCPKTDHLPAPVKPLNPLRKEAKK